MHRRFVGDNLAMALDDTPVVILQGPRQCGKTTLARQHPGEYITLDDDLHLDTAERRPAALLKGHEGLLILDEVQRAPKIFRALKKAVDDDRAPGRFLLTGSANILLLPKLAESLAGRMEVIPLWPLAQAEIEQTPGQFAEWAFSDRPCKAHDATDDLGERMDAGGFPEPITRSNVTRRDAWFGQYVKAILERDVRDLARVEGLAALPRLLRLVAARTHEPLNISALSRESGIPHTTLGRYLALFEAAFLTLSLPAWDHDGDRNATRTAKTIFVDTGVRGTLTPNLDIANFVAMELVKQATWSRLAHRVMHFRSIRRYSVPLVLEVPDGRIVGIAITSDPEVVPEDFDGLRFLRDLAGPKWHRGLVLHPGDAVQRAEADLIGVPMRALWEAE